MGNFDGWSITEICFNYIRDLLPDGGTILELGSGFGTDILSKYYKMYSIENDKKWVDEYNSTYIHAPIVFYDDNTEFSVPEGIPRQRGWYNPDIVKTFLAKIEKYDLILVDGPNGGKYGRGGFYKYLDLFNTDVFIIFDDINRESERILIEKVSKKINRNYTMLDDVVTGVISNVHYE
tara:strand:- start:485 stop:1018 length:534 start_codon:yes stop_codon:yes gene_type:complete